MNARKAPAVAVPAAAVPAAAVPAAAVSAAAATAAGEPVADVSTVERSATHAGPTGQQRRVRADERFIGLDLGSTAIKGVAVSGAGDVVSTASAAMERLPNADGATFEIDPEAFIQSIFALIARLSPDPAKTLAISWVAASGNILLLDGQDQPLAPMISWLDERPLDGSIETACAAVDAKALYESVGWPLSRQFPYCRLLWLRARYPQLLERCRRICTGNDWLGYRLTGSWAIDRSTATTMYVYDQAAGSKHAGRLAQLGLAPAMFSELRESGSFLGMVQPALRDLTGLGPDTSAWLGSFDHPGAARALGIHTRDQLMLSCGTSWVGLVLLPDRARGIEAQLLIDPYESGSGGDWCGMFSLTSIGKRIDAWFDAIFQAGMGMCHELEVPAGGGRDARFEILNRLAAQTDPLGDIPILDLGALRADVTSVTALLRAFGPGASFRGLMESAAFEFRRLLGARLPFVPEIRELAMVGGPANSPAWRQIVADALGRPLGVRFASHAGAVGAALMAARGAGHQLCMREPVITIVPDGKASHALDERYQRFVSGNSTRP
jgi:sugar (pentulose or hexulose) kinase